MRCNCVLLEHEQSSALRITTEVQASQGMCGIFFLRKFVVWYLNGPEKSCAIRRELKRTKIDGKWEVCYSKRDKEKCKHTSME